MPFGEYLADMRLNYGENLLRSSALSATEIAYEAGFTSLSYFSRCFQKKFNCSPREYRKNHQEEAK
jgi:AraC-like DNA-binding protein